MRPAQPGLVIALALKALAASAVEPIPPVPAAASASPGTVLALAAAWLVLAVAPPDNGQAYGHPSLLFNPNWDSGDPVK